MVLLCRFFVGLCRGDSELAWVCCGFCNRWQQKWFLCASSVMDSVTGGSENGFSLPVLRGTMLASKHARLTARGL